MKIQKGLILLKLFKRVSPLTSLVHKRSFVVPPPPPPQWSLETLEAPEAVDKFTESTFRSWEKNLG